MTAAVGLPTLRLVRSAIGLGGKQEGFQLSLAGLNPGEWREVTKTEREALENLQ
jgi:23S rRNA pseudouridine2457 synthase